MIGAKERISDWLLERYPERLLCRQIAVGRRDQGSAAGRRRSRPVASALVQVQAQSKCAGIGKPSRQIERAARRYSLFWVSSSRAAFQHQSRPPRHMWSP
jgi:hypothetical protein